METVRDYHIRRIREELDLAYRADDRAASSAHLRLSALHVNRLRALDPRDARGLAPGEARIGVLA